MNSLAILNIPQPICAFCSNYNVNFLNKNSKMFDMCFEQKIIAMHTIPLPRKQIKTKVGTVYPQLLFILDNHLNWALFGFTAAAGSYQQRIKQIVSSKSIDLFGYVPVLQTKERKQLKCFISCLQLKQKVLVVLQINLCSKDFTVLQLHGLDSQLSFMSVRRDIQNTTAYTNFIKSKQIVWDKYFNYQPQVEISHSFFSRYLVLKEQGGVYSLLSLMVDCKSYQQSTGKTILLNIPSSVVDISVIDKTVLFVVTETCLILYSVSTQQSQRVLGIYRILQQPNPNIYVVANQQQKQVQEFEVNPTLKLECKTIAKFNLQITEACLSGKSGVYMLSKQNNLHYGQIRQQQIQLVKVISNQITKICSVHSVKDKYSNILIVQKQTGLRREIVCLTQQPYYKCVLKMKHNIPLLHSEVYLVDKNTLLFTSSLLGSLFVDISYKAGRLTFNNNQSFRDLEKTQRTLLFHPLQNGILQLTQSKIVIKKPKDKQIIQTRQLFDNMSIVLDFGVILHNTLLLVIHGQIHAYTIQPKLNSRFVYVFDDQIEFICNINNYQVLAIKFVGINVLKFYSIDKQKEQLCLLKQYSSQYQLKIIKSYGMEVTINGQKYKFTILQRMDQVPLLIIVPNEDYLRKNFNIRICQLTMLNAWRVVPVSHDQDKHIYIVGDVLLTLPKSFIIPDISQLTITVTKMLTNQWQQPLAYFYGKPVSISVGKQSVQLREEVTGRYKLEYELMRVEGYRVQILFSGSQVNVVAYSKQQQDILQGQNFSKTHQIKTIASEVKIEEGEFPFIVGKFNLQSMQPIKCIQLKGSILLLWSRYQIWVVRIVNRDNTLHIVLFSKFSYDNQDFLAFNTKLPQNDTNDPIFMNQFSRKHPIQQIETLDCSQLFTLGRNYLIILYQKFILILQLDCLVFKVHQVIVFQQQIELILDNYQQGAALLRGSNYMYKLLKNSATGKFQIIKDVYLDDTVVFASCIQNWASPSRTFKLDSITATPDSSSNILVKQSGQLECVTTDCKGNTQQSETYI